MDLKIWRLAFVAAAGILFFSGLCLSERAPDFSFLHEASIAPKISYHDYIIVGGGTAGCPLAATLSHKADVLLLERGGSPYGDPNITDMTRFGASFSDVSPDSPSQTFVSEDGVVNRRGRVLGGSTAINAGFYSRAERWFVERSGWDRKLVEDSFRWAERKVAFVRSVKQWQSAARAGMLEVGIRPYNGDTFDHVVGTKIGGSIFNESGQRHTAANLLEYADPRGLTVLLHSTVQKILFRVKGQSRPMAYGVVFKDRSGAEHTALLKKGIKNEIILSAGALGSPQLLMLSGVGPKEKLQGHNISVVLDQPLVGQGMADNPMNAVLVPSPLPVEASIIQVVAITSFGSYIETGCGIDLGAPPNIISLLGLHPEGLPDPAKFENLDQTSFEAGFFIEKVKGPLSKGFLELRNVDPDDNPSVRFNYFKDPRDLQTCVRGINLAQKLYESKAFSRFRYRSLSFRALLNISANKNITSVEQFCKDTVTTMWHYHGGCQVGKVVDRDYKLLGVDALRVVDGSTFDSTPGTNPQATVMMFGRYMGVKIARERMASTRSRRP